ncbi:MAG: sterol desaturase family protein [Deltaproteobacteria bacterium]|nr:sterol desaturase family protein [Deltaproteobacteria bacterium]MBW2497242.1 sterol desaturase family protein [Deltaproteobacteria bacterium]
MATDEAHEGIAVGADLRAIAPRTPFETLFAWSVFPVVMTLCVGWAIHLHERDAGWLWPLLGPMILGYALVILGERLCPYVPDWNRSHDDVATDAAWWLSINVTGLALRPLAAFVALPIGAWLSARFGSELWPSEWPLLGQLLLALVIVEFFQYWAHRWMHEIDFLWRFHATHHSAPRLYWLNAARFHIVDIALLNLGLTIPLAALGADARVLSLWIVASAIHGLFQHSNMQIRCGWLNWIFSMAELHRWHHSRTIREANTNYGQNLILWDIVFGSRFLPKDREPPADIGIAGLPAFPMTWWQQMISPLRWAAIKRASAASDAH